MKKNLFLRLCLIVIAMLSLNSCRQDILHEQETYNNTSAFQLTSQRISLNEAQHKTNLIPKIKQVETNLYTESKNNLQGKTVNFRNGISIDTDDVIYLEKGSDFHSYTFRINHENAPYNAPIENLVISSRPDGTWKEVLVTYYLTAQERQNLLSGGTVDFTGKVTHEILQNGTYSSAIMQQDVMNCYLEVSTYYTRCGGKDDHHNGELPVAQGGPCETTTPSVLVVSLVRKCTMALPVDTGLGENGEGGGSGPGGLGSNPPDETTTAPNLPLPFRNLTPCIQLQIMNANTNIKAKITELKDNIGGTNEKGILIRNIPGNETSEIILGPDNGDIVYPYYENSYSSFVNQTYGTAHNHLSNNPNHIGIFTPEDINQLYMNGFIETYPGNPYYITTPKKAIVFVITDKGYFALKITDLDKLRIFVNWYGNLTIGKRGEYLVDVFQNEKEYNITPTATHDQQVTGFLRFMQDKDIGVELYEGNKDTFGDWKKLELVDNGNGTYGYSQTPCNL
jgi:hypothetical protein